MGAAQEALLTVDGVSKSFEGVHALIDVSFQIKAGHIKALIGPNGAGKTTLLNVINGLLLPDEGTVSLRGHELTRMKTEQIAMLGVSRTFQLVRLFTVNDATVLDNVLLGAHKRINPTILGTLFLRSRSGHKERVMREKAMEALSFVGMDWAADRVPTALSFGNQRLVELARSLMAEPELLLLDEPASGLNDAEVEQFLQLLMAVRARGVTILLVEHNMNLVMRLSDDIVVLDFGKRLAEGDPASICANPAVIEAYLGSECAIGGGSG
ncbi:MAG TPA: ABC transporter ATP-binding protein [Syntrophorhabdales bacterium]|nr:ABC transporter ATP-binding protein [Syntrophorhabdales bacterium]